MKMKYLRMREGLGGGEGEREGDEFEMGDSEGQRRKRKRQKILSVEKALRSKFKCGTVTCEASDGHEIEILGCVKMEVSPI